MLKLNTKIKGFTLLETMVSIVVLMIVFSLSTLLINNLSSSGITREKQNAHLLVKNMRNEAIMQHRYVEEVIDVENITLVKSIAIYPKGADLHVLQITATKGDKLLFESKDIVIINTEK